MLLKLKFWTKERTDLPSPRIEVLRLVEKGRIQVHCCNHRKHFPPTWNVIPFIKFWRKKSTQINYNFNNSKQCVCRFRRENYTFQFNFLPLYRTSFRAFLCRNLTTFPSLSVSLITFTCHYRMFLYGTISNRTLCFFFFLMEKMVKRAYTLSEFHFLVVFPTQFQLSWLLLGPGNFKVFFLNVEERTLWWFKRRGVYY